MQTAHRAVIRLHLLYFFFSSRRRHTRYWRDWSSDMCSSDLTQEELAEKAHVSARVISDLERGARQSPRGYTVRQLADALELSDDDRATFHECARKRLAVVRELPEVQPDEAEQARQAAQVRTFLIADIRGYTRFTVERGDPAAARLTEKFAALARECISARGGEVLELRGDEVLAVFGSVRQALHAAVELQDRLAQETASDPHLPLLAGIGLDAGEAIPVDGGYRGAALNL